MKNIVIVCILLVISLTIQTDAYAQIYTYAHATNGAPGFVNANASGTNITAYGGSTNTACAQGYSGRDGFNVSGYSTSHPSLGIVVKPNTGYVLNITGFTVRTRRSGTGPQSIRLAYSLDGGSTWTDKGTNDAPKNGSCATSTSRTNLATWNVSISVTSVTNGIMFRIFPFGASSASGTIQIWGAFDINGTVDPAVSCTPPTLSTNVTNVTCYGGNDGAITLSTTGGTSPFTYSWSGPGSYTSTSKNISGLSAGNYTVIVTATGNCKDTAYVTITEPAPVVPSVQITATSDTICAGTNVTFTATAVNGGSAPTFQWKVNGLNAGGNSTTYTSGTLSNNDVVTCVMTSNANCAAPTTATSNGITMVVNSPATPTITIVANPGNIVCSSTNVTFTATATNGGTTPSYQWKLNNINTGSNSSTYSNSSINNNDVITCELTSNSSCITSPTASSNAISMSIVSTVTPTVSISTSSTNICAGAQATFMATSTYGGTSPTYQWKVNGINAGTNSTTFVSSSLSNNDIVTCQMTSNSLCASTSTVTSNSVTMTVNPVLTPSVTISASKTNICTGTSITFTATATNNTNSTYQWKINGTNVGTNSATYTSNSLSNSDVVTCVLTSARPCAIPAVVTSNSITITVAPWLTPSINIAVSPGNTICAGASVTFTGTGINTGSTPAYQWIKNGVLTGSNASTYTVNNLNNGDVISCVLTSSYMCATKADDTSNTINMIVNPVITPSVSISATSSVICAGTSVTFTATPANGGTPSYQWKKNGTNVGSNSATYTTSTLANNDIITCVLTTSLPCATSVLATSNSIKMTVNPVLTPSISVTSSHGNQACAGQTVVFTANTTHPGSAPVFQWQKNGVYIGTNSGTYSDAGLISGDKIRCILTSSEVCASPASKNSNEIIMTIDSLNTSQAFIISSSNDSVCEDEEVTFYCHFTKGGTGYKFQWIRNGMDMPGNTAGTYTTDSLKDNDVIQCRFTNGYHCAQPVTTKPINVIVSPNAAPTATIVATPNHWAPVGTNITFIATVTGEGAQPTYQWMKDQKDIPGATGKTYSTTGLKSSDKISLKMRSSLPCTEQPYIVSNTVIMKIGTGIDNISTSSDPVVVFPNPNNGNFVISTKSGTHAAVTGINIINSTGQIVYRSAGKTNINGSGVTIQMNGKLSAGIYLVHLTFTDGHKEYVRFSVRD